MTTEFDVENTNITNQYMICIISQTTTYGLFMVFVFFWQKCCTIDRMSKRALPLYLFILEGKKAVGGEKRREAEEIIFLDF